MGAVKYSNCLIVGAGEVSPQTVAHCGQSTSRLIIAADGGYLRCSQHGLIPDLILGDFDSAPMPQTTAETQVFPSHKDDTDCMLAVKEGLHRGCTDFTIIGGMGGRLDHTIANIQTLVYLANHAATGRMIDGQHTLTVIKGGAQATRVQGIDGHLSLFSLGDRCTGVTLRGVDYPLTDAVLENGFPLGVSNRISGEHCEIYIKTGTLLIMTVLE